MSKTETLNVVILPTQTIFSNPWHVERTTGGSKINYECSLQLSQNVWYLYVTIPGCHPPYTKDFKPGDELHVYEKGVGTGQELKGSVVVVQLTQPPPIYVTTYTYWSSMSHLTP